MARKTRAGKIKNKLREITAHFTESGSGTNSREVVNELRKSYSDIIELEKDDILDVGLMILAGRVSVSNGPNQMQSDLFSENGLSHYVNIGGTKFDARQLTAKDLFDKFPINPKEKKKNSSQSKNQKLREILDEMKEKNCLHMTIIEFLKK